MRTRKRRSPVLGASPRRRPNPNTRRENEVSDYTKVTLDNLNRGVVTDLFEREFEKVMENIADENTSAKAVRKITIEIAIRPSEDRGRADTKVTAKSTLASVKANEHYMVFGARHGKPEAYTTDPHEQELPLDAEGSNIRHMGGTT